MVIVGRHLIFVANSKDIPAGGQHGVHGRAGSREKFNQCPDSDSGQGLLDNVVVFSKIDLPVELLAKIIEAIEIRELLAQTEDTNVFFVFSFQEFES
jgi:hypothetical protein